VALTKAERWLRYRESRKPYVTRSCERCGTQFAPRGRQARCEDCRMATCETCGKRFISPNGRRDARFCSRSCVGAHPDNITRLGTVRGTKPRTYHLRHRDKHGSAADRDWRNAVFARDGYTCQACGQKGGRLQAHHIQPFKARPDLRHDLANGQTLCVPCHRKTDSYGWSSYWRQRKKIAAKRLQQSVLALEMA
jgi:5-methylcytosine-specific restriction endonuclease McrA